MYPSIVGWDTTPALSSENKLFVLIRCVFGLIIGKLFFDFLGGLSFLVDAGFVRNGGPNGPHPHCHSWNPCFVNNHHQIINVPKHDSWQIKYHVDQRLTNDHGI